MRVSNEGVRVGEDMIVCKSVSLQESVSFYKRVSTEGSVHSDESIVVKEGVGGNCREYKCL